MKNIISLILITFLIHLSCEAQKTKPKQYLCSHLNNDSIVLDGFIDEEAWSKVVWTEDFIDIQGANFPKPYQQTKAKMLWNDSTLYLAIYMEEAHIWANIEKDEEIMYHDNDIEVFIDPSGDHHHYYEFEFNARNKKWDLYFDWPYRDVVYPVLDWTCEGLKHEVQFFGSLNDPNGKADSAWTIEIAIPLNQIQYGIKEGSTWRINFSRVQWETTIEEGQYKKKDLAENNWVWSPTWDINMHRPEYWGELLFVKDMKSQVEGMSEKEWLIRQELIQAYEYQRDYWRLNKSYAEDWPNKDQGVLMTSEGFQALYTKELEGELWKVNEKGRIWKDKSSLTPKFWIWMSGHKAMSTEEWEQVFSELQSLGIRGLLLSASNNTLKMLVPIAQRYEIQLHVWMWAMNRGDAPAEYLSVNDLNQSLSEERAYVDYYKFMCPALTEAKAFIEDRVKELERAEGIQGIHLDYIRYVDVFLPSGLLPKYDLIQDDILPEFDYGYHPYLLEKFEKEFGYHPKSIPDYPHDSLWQQFRMDQVSHIVNSLALQFSTKKTKLSAAVFPDPLMSRKMVRQDWGNWNLDYYFPMVYNGFYEAGMDWIEKRLQISKSILPESKIFCGLYLGDSKNDKTLEQSIEAAFRGGATGISFFDYWGMKEHHKAAIRKSVGKYGEWLEQKKNP